MIASGAQAKVAIVGDLVCGRRVWLGPRVAVEGGAQAAVAFLGWTGARCPRKSNRPAVSGDGDVPQPTVGCHSVGGNSNRSLGRVMGGGGSGGPHPAATAACHGPQAAAAGGAQV